VSACFTKKENARWSNLGLWREGKERLGFAQLHRVESVPNSPWLGDPNRTHPLPPSSSSSPPDLSPAHGLQSAAAVLYRRRRRLYRAPSPYPSSLPPYLIAPPGPCCLHPVRTLGRWFPRYEPIVLQRLLKSKLVNKPLQILGVPVLTRRAPPLPAVDARLTDFAQPILGQRGPYLRLGLRSLVDQRVHVSR
jgi:hypothetical protein